MKSTHIEHMLDMGRYFLGFDEFTKVDVMLEEFRGEPYIWVVNGTTN